MVFGLFKKNPSLAKRCETYLKVGPPASMNDYVSGSLTEIIISHGANQQPLDPELQEIAGMVLFEASEMGDFEDKAIQTYMEQGFTLVREVLDAQ